jgi:hypothetical protein
LEHGVLEAENCGIGEHDNFLPISDIPG